MKSRKFDVVMGGMRVISPKKSARAYGRKPIADAKRAVSQIGALPQPKDEHD